MQRHRTPVAVAVAADPVETRYAPPPVEGGLKLMVSHTFCTTKKFTLVELSMDYKKE
jgi:hypothetical protein